MKDMTSDPYCPKCGTKLIWWMRLRDSEIVCQCPNPSCVMRPIETTGDTVSEAIDRFHGEALRVKGEKV